MQLKVIKVCWYHDSILLILIFYYTIQCLQYLHHHHFKPRAKHGHMPNQNPLCSLPLFFAFAIHVGVWGTAQLTFIDIGVFAITPPHMMSSPIAHNLQTWTKCIYIVDKKMRFCYTASVNEANNIKNR